MEDKTIELLNYLIKGGSTSLTKSNSSEVLDIFPKLRNLGVLTFSGKSSYHLNMENRASLKKLVELNSFEKYLNWLDQENQKTHIKSTTNQMSNERKIFISHSSLDSKIVEQVIELLEGMGVPSDLIFCSSFEGYNIGLGEDFLETIRKELNQNVLVLFILSPNFYNSPISLCEMGATWVKTSEHVPILIPPFDYRDVKGVIPYSQGMKVNDKLKINSLKDKIEIFLSLKPKNSSAWERKRDLVIASINEILVATKQLPLDNFKTENEQVKLAISKEHDEIIKRNAKKEWPEDFEMQVNYITKQKKALKNLMSHAPTEIDEKEFNIIRKNAKVEWPEDFEMQYHYETKQVAKLIELNQL